MNLLMVRHGEIPSNVKKIYAGKSSEGLTAEGLRQAAEAAGKLKAYHIVSLYSSPVCRARQTADLIGEHIGRTVQIDEAFREMELGPWEGMSEQQIAEKYPIEWHTWLTAPAELKLRGRETLDELLNRVLTGIREIGEDSGESNIVIVTHVAVIRVLLLWHEHKTLNLYKTIHVPNAGIFKIKIDSFNSKKYKIR